MPIMPNRQITSIYGIGKRLQFVIEQTIEITEAWLGTWCIIGLSFLPHLRIRFWVHRIQHAPNSHISTRQLSLNQSLGNYLDRIFFLI